MPQTMSSQEIKQELGRRIEVVNRPEFLDLRGPPALSDADERRQPEDAGAPARRHGRSHCFRAQHRRPQGARRSTTRTTRTPCSSTRN